MAKKDPTLLLLPSGGGQAWSIKLSRSLIAGCLAAVVATVTLFVAGSVVLLHSAEKSLECANLAEENRLLKERLRDLEGSVDGLMASVERSAEFQRRASVLANMDEFVAEFRQMGIGGPVLTGNEPLTDYDPSTATLVVDLESRLDELKEQCRFQEENFDEILQRLDDQNELWACTPSICPVRDGWPSSGFGRRKDPFTDVPAMHLGLDFSAPRGSPIYATADGRVISAGWHKEFGRTVEIDHGNGIVTRYAHNDKLTVKRGQMVSRGQIIATVGRSGRATAPHVHYEVRIDGVPVNPWKYILNTDLVVN